MIQFEEKEKNFLNSWKLIGKNRIIAINYVIKIKVKKRKNGVLYNEIFQ